MALAPILLAALAVASANPVDPSSPPLAEVKEKACRILVEQEGGKPIIVPAPDIHVLEQSARNGEYSPSLPPGTTGIACRRSTIVPAAHDDEVPMLGLILLFDEIGTSRVASLERIGGSYRFILHQGTFRPGEQELVQARLAGFEAKRNRATQ